MMKKISLTIIVLLLLFSCGKEKTYYEIFNKRKTITERVSDLNKDLNEVRKIETGKITREDIDYLEYEYPIGEGDSYVVSYLFDQKGCYEIGIDGYFATQENAIQLLNEFKSELTITFGPLKKEINWHDG